MNIRHFAIAFWSMLLWASVQASAVTTGLNDDGDSDVGLSGWREAVITTHDPDVWIDFLTKIAGWEVRTDGPTSDGLHRLWQLPETTTGREVLLANVGADRGFIRLVKLNGVSQDWIRADARPWDTGGHFDLNMRVVGLRDVRRAMLEAGWHGDSPPIQYTFGPFEVIEWIAQGPDGVRLALIERLKPELEGWPHLQTISRTFNATQTVADMASARRFYEEVLGMKVYLEHVGASRKPGQNVLGLTYEDAATIPREIYILHPSGVNDGSVELLAFEGVTGTDFSTFAAPHNLGLSVLRFEVSDLDATIAAVSRNGGEFDAPPATLRLAPYGTVRAVAVTSPEGARLEFYELGSD